MKKKLSFLMLAFAIVGAGLLGSCKDYNEDRYNDYRSASDLQYNTLKTQLATAQTDITNLQTQLATCQANCSTKIANLQAQITSNDGDITVLQSQIAALQTKDTQLQSAIDGIKNVLDTLGNCIGEGGNPQSALVYLFTTATDAQAKAEAALDSILNLKSAGFGIDSTQLAQMYKEAAKASALAEKDSLLIDNLKAYVDSIDQALSDSIAAAKALADANLQKAKDYADAADAILKQELLNTIDAKVADAVAALQAADQLLQNQIDALKSDVAANTAKIAALDTKVADLIEDVEDLEEANEKRITSLLVQGTINPAFGTFALPIGIQSNILMGYYGKFDTDIDFPTQSTAHIATGTALSAKEAALIGLDAVQETFSPYDLKNDDMSAGKILLTVNPNEVEIDNTYEFSFVNSQGVESKAKIGALTASNEKLTFGVSTPLTKAGVTSATGLFEAPVTFKGEDGASMTPDIDKAAIKEVAKDVLSFRDGVDLKKVGSTVLKTMDGLLDAYAVNVKWSDSYGEHNVKTQYGVAVTAVRPLSYNTLADMSISKSLPTIPDLSAVSFHIDPLVFTPMTFHIDSIEVFANVKSVEITDQDVKVKVAMPDYPAPGDTTYFDGYASNSFASITVAIDDAVLENIEQVRHKMNNFIDEIRNQVSDLTTELNGLLGDINTMLSDTEADVNSQFNSYINKANSYIDKVNTWINRVNNKIHSFNPNTMLQPTILYSNAKGDLHQLSGNVVFPTNVTGFTPGDGMVLNLTSYSAELLAPAYKKHVAVTDVIKISDGTSAQGGNAACKTILQNTNAADGFNEVLDGDVVKVGFQPAAAGYIYQIAYSAIDYNGKIATRRFFVAVK